MGDVWFQRIWKKRGSGSSANTQRKHCLLPAAVLTVFSQFVWAEVGSLSLIGRYEGSLILEGKVFGSCTLDFEKETDRHATQMLNFVLKVAPLRSPPKELINVELPISLVRRWLTQNGDIFEFPLDNLRTVSSGFQLGEAGNRIPQLFHSLWMRRRSETFRDVYRVDWNISIVPNLEKGVISDIRLPDFESEGFFAPFIRLFQGESPVQFMSCHLQQTEPGLRVITAGKDRGRVSGDERINSLLRILGGPKSQRAQISALFEAAASE